MAKKNWALIYRPCEMCQFILLRVGTKSKLRRDLAVTPYLKTVGEATVVHRHAVHVVLTLLNGQAPGPGHLLGE